MAKARRPLVAAPSPPEAPSQVWPHPFVVFSDLHVWAATLTQARHVLDKVGELAEERKAGIVCTGDFWNLRGTLNVRQVDEVLRAIEQWHCPWWFVPGNHDQVSIDGQIHGLNIFRAFARGTVVDEPLLLPELGIAFVPWREEGQDALYKLSASAAGPYTIFGHAEVQNAVSNNGRLAPGKVALGTLESHRAVYLGHYHKRQRLGTRGHVWYIGSPYQQNAGERDDPHGIAVVTGDRVEPEFVNLEDLPKYWRFDMASTEWDVSRVREQDIAEIVVPRELIGSEDFRKAAAMIPAGVVRPKPAETPDVPAASSFALGLVDGLDQYVAEHAAESGISADVLRDYGRSILSEIPEAAATVALGSIIDIADLHVENFCALRGKLHVPIEDVDFTLLRGPVRTGKTAVADAVMWCLYGQTSPRKAGQAGATFRGDEVIHDGAPSCAVSCELRVAGRPAPVRVRREKVRGKGAKLFLDGLAVAEGIADQQVLLDRAIGIPYTLARVCVSIGQGAVANFVTDADKRRKELLEAAFDLESCPKAQVAARTRERALQASLDDLRRQHAVAEGQFSALSALDFTVQIAQWDKQREEALAAIRTRGETIKGQRESCVTALAGESEWLAARERFEKQIETLTASLASASPTARIAELQRQYGGIEAEAAIVQRDLNTAKGKLEKAVAQASGGGDALCPTCAQPFPKSHLEEHMRALENEVRSKAFESTTLRSRASNLSVELDNLNSQKSADTEGTKAALDEARQGLRKCGEALTQFTRIRANLEAADRQLEDLRTQFREQSALVNPFGAKAEEARTKLVELRACIDALAYETAEGEAKLKAATFWVEGFGPKGIPVLVLRTVIYDLESAANRHLAALLDGTLLVRLRMDGDDLGISYLETDVHGSVRERSYEQLSGGQRRCAELSFCPLGLSDVIFARRGVRIPLLVIDELTTHLGEAEKQRACERFAASGRKVLVIDHDPSVQGHFERVWSLTRDAAGVRLEGAS